MASQRVRVLQLIDGFSMGGAERVVLMLALHSDRERFDVIPCALYRSGPLEEEMKAAGIHYHVLGLQRRSVLSGPLFVGDVLRILSALSKMIREFSVDIVHTHLTESTLLGILAAFRASCRTCATLHNVIIDGQRGRFSPRNWLMRFAINQVFSKANTLIAVSEEVAQAVKANARIPQNRIVTIPNAIDSTRFSMRRDRNSVRAALGFAVDRTIVLTIGRLTRQKGYTHLLQALRLIPAYRRPLTLFVGDGEERQLLESKTIELGLGLDVRFLGNRRDIPELLAAADIFVLSSLWEGLSLALLEAMASGLPPVVTSVGGNTEVVENGKCGLVVPPGNEQALAEAILALLQNPFWRGELARAARERFENQFSLRSFVDAHERLYTEMAGSLPMNDGPPPAHDYFVSRHHNCY